MMKNDELLAGDFFACDAGRLSFGFGMSEVVSNWCTYKTDFFALSFAPCLMLYKDQSRKTCPGHISLQK